MSAPDIETWVCATCGHPVPKTSVYGFVGWMAAINRHTREHEEVQQSAEKREWRKAAHAEGADDYYRNKEVQ